MVIFHSSHWYWQCLDSFGWWSMWTLMKLRCKWWQFVSCKWFKPVGQAGCNRIHKNTSQVICHHSSSSHASNLGNAVYKLSLDRKKLHLRWKQCKINICACKTLKAYTHSENANTKDLSPSITFWCWGFFYGLFGHGIPWNPPFCQLHRWNHGESPFRDGSGSANCCCHSRAEAPWSTMKRGLLR